MKALEDVDTLSGLMSWTVVPNFRALGPRLGPRVNDVKAALAAADGSELAQRSRPTGSWRWPASGSGPTTSRCGPCATRRSPWPRRTAGRSPSTSSSTTTCAARASPASWSASLNDLRKEVGLDIADRIRLAVTADGAVADALAVHRDYVMAEVLAVELTSGGASTHTITIDGQPVGIDITRA